MALFFEDFFNSVFGSNGITFKKSVTVAGNTPVTAGGALVLGVGSTTAPNFYTGSGLPTISAPQGSLYMRTDGSSTSTRLYVNTTGSTTWTNVTTAA